MRRYIFVLDFNFPFVVTSGLAIEHALSTASTVVTVIGDCVKRFRLNDALADQTKVIDEIWEQVIE